MKENMDMRSPVDPGDHGQNLRAAWGVESPGRPADASWVAIAGRDGSARAARGRAILGSAVVGGKWYVVPVLLSALVVVHVVPVAEELPAPWAIKMLEAQQIVDAQRLALSIDQEVEIALVAYHPFVFSVEPADARREVFRLSMEVGFLQMLSEGELRAALAHELGHVWIFTNHPFLQTERLANDVGQRVVSRESLEKLYGKLWAYEGTPGVAIETLLGPGRDETSLSRP